jgi:hypothetical protein
MFFFVITRPVFVCHNMWRLGVVALLVLRWARWYRQRRRVLAAVARFPHTRGHWLFGSMVEVAANYERIHDWRSARVQTLGKKVAFFVTRFVNCSGMGFSTSTTTRSNPICGHCRCGQCAVSLVRGR